jgi:RimJ/RimL family protein N-acetyltransferase
VTGPLADLPAEPKAIHTALDWPGPAAAALDWPGPAAAAGRFALRPVDTRGDLNLVHGWMNDPEVATFWELDGPRERTERHLLEQSTLDYSAAYLGLLDDEPMSYWEVYRADLDPLLAGHYPAVAHDYGLHLLIGPSALRGRGIGSVLLGEMVERCLTADPLATRVLAEPDVRNTPSVRAFIRAGFRQLAVIQLAGKRAALMVRPRDPHGTGKEFA